MIESYSIRRKVENMDRMTSTEILTRDFLTTNSKIVKAKDLLDTKSRTIVLDSNGIELQGEMLVVGYPDDVYNRTTPKYKSHEKKCKK